MTIVDEASLTAAQADLAREYFGQQQTFQVSPPDGPVSVGDTWKVEETYVSSGMTLPVTYDYALTALDADTYTMSVTVDSPIDTEIEGAAVSGTMTMNGTLVGSRSNPLVVSGDLTLAMSMSDGQFSIDISAAIGVDSVDVPATGAAPATTAAAPATPAAPTTAPAPAPPTPPVTAPTTTVG